MKTLTLNLTIMGGSSLTGIVFTLYKIGNTECLIKEFREKSFTYNFNLENNTGYNLYISGTNPKSENKNTKIELLGKGITFHGNIKNPTERKGDGYFIKYSFDTN